MERCSITGCLGEVLAKSWCSKHYGRWYRYGDVSFTKYNTGEGNSEIERFWSKVNVTLNHNECWEWLGGKQKRLPYGVFRFQGKRRTTHCIAWILRNGREPSLSILHKCDNPPCCNPAHLYEGTQQENMRDAVERDRHLGRRTNIFIQ